MMLPFFVAQMVLAVAALAPADERIPTSTVVVFAADGESVRQSTGVLLDRDSRWLLASCHAVQGSKTLSVLFPLRVDGQLVTAPLPYQERRRRGQAIAAHVVAVDRRRDLAILELDSVPEEAIAVVFAAPPHVRDLVTLIGNPPDRNVLWQRSTAVVLGAGPRKWDYGDGQTVETTTLEVSVTAALADGYSGGPVFNRKRELAAVIAAEKERGSTTIYCIDTAAIRLFVLETQLRENWLAVRSLHWLR
jgi:serine protease Do